MILHYTVNSMKMGNISFLFSALFQVSGTQDTEETDINLPDQTDTPGPCLYSIPCGCYASKKA